MIRVHREHKVGLVDLSLEGPMGFPEGDLGFAVQWRAPAKGVRKAMRQTPVRGVIVQCEMNSLEATIGILRAVEREHKQIPVWLVMSTPRAMMLAKVVSARRLYGGPVIDLQALTPRELEVLISIRQGSTNQAIARGLGISLSTVKRHVEHILEKLSAKNRAQAAALMRGQKS